MSSGPVLSSASVLTFAGERERNLVLVAAEGLGKTMIARNVIHDAAGGRAQSNSAAPR